MLLRSFGLVTSAVWLAGMTLVAQSEDKYTANQRILRIRDLGKKNADAIPAVAEYLSDPNRNIRIEAVKAIIKLDTEASLEPLARATHDNDAEIQIRATDGLVNFYLPGYVAKGALTGPVTRGMRQMRSFFSARNDQRIDAGVTVRPDVAEALAAEIRGGASMDARSNAARAAGILRAHAAVPALEDGLRSKNTELIFESLIALEKIGDPATGPSIAFLVHDLDNRIQIEALEAIGMLRATSAAQDVRGVVRDARNDKVRRAALESLAMLGLPEDRQIFLPYLNDKDPDLRAAALEGLGRIRDPQDYPAIEQAYNAKDADPKVHLAAAFALVNEGKVDTSEFSPLPYLLESLEVKGRSNRALAYLTELCRRDDVRRALFPLVPEATKDQKIALCSAFGASGSPDVIPVLNTLSKDIDPDVSIAAARALKTVEASRPSQPAGF